MPRADIAPVGKKKVRLAQHFYCKNIQKMYICAINMSSGTVRAWIIEQARHGRTSFTRAELCAAFPGVPGARLGVELYRACRSRLAAVAWQGFYLILPPEYQAVGMLPPAEYIDKLMAYMGKPYCVALLNAAAHYGAAHQRPMNFTVMTSQPLPRSTVKRVNRIDFVSKSEMKNGIPTALVRRVKTQYGTMVVSSPEFTACTLVQYAKAAGGLAHVVSVLQELVEACDFSRLPSELAAYVPTPCLQRLGYILERVLGERTAARALHRHLLSICPRLRKTRLVPQLPSTHGETDDKWGILINQKLTTEYDD